jgi:hypothetical protein
MKTADGYVVTTSIISRMVEIISMLPDEQQGRCGQVVDVLNELIQQLENESMTKHKKCCFEQLRKRPMTQV